MDDRFEVVGKQYFGNNDYIEILREKQTGVMYVYRRSGNSGGLSILVDKDGKPQTT